jgi:hypothetical protein
MASTAQAGVYVPTFQQDEVRHRKKIASWAQWVNQGHLANVGNVTLNAGATTTVVNDSRAGLNTYVGLSPTTANGASAAATCWISSFGKGTFTITHANSASVDKSYRYCLLG